MELSSAISTDAAAATAVAPARSVLHRHTRAAAAFAVLAAVAAPPASIRSARAPRALVRHMRRTRRRSLTDDDGEDGLSGDDGPFGGGGSGGGGGRGWGCGEGGGWWGSDWEDSYSPRLGSSIDPALYFVYEVVCWLALSNCVHFSLRKAGRLLTERGSWFPSDWCRRCVDGLANLIPFTL